MTPVVLLLVSLAISFAVVRLGVLAFEREEAAVLEVVQTEGSVAADGVAGERLRESGA